MIVTTVNFPDNNKIHVIENFFTNDLAENLLHWFSQYRNDTDSWQSLEKFSHRLGRLIYTKPHPLLSCVTDYASSHSVLDILSGMVKTSLAMTAVEAWIDLENYAILPHEDYMDDHLKFYGLQVYFSDQINYSQGTCFYYQNRPLLNLPLRQNLAYFLDRGDRVAHGLAHPVPPGCHRYSLHLKYSQT
jgi:hypothetical protein